MNRNTLKTSLSLHRQRGVVLFIALIVLVTMTLAGIGMMRSIDTGAIIAGNLAFTQGTIHGGDRGVETGITWLKAQSATTLKGDALPGYFANWQDNFNPATFDWGAQAVNAGIDASGNTVSYVAHRMCKTSGLDITAPGQSCKTLEAVGGESESKDNPFYQAQFSKSWQVYYRITAKTEGPKNTVSYVQVMIH